MSFDYIPTSPSLQDLDGSATCNVFWVLTHLKHQSFFLRFFLNLGVVPNSSTPGKLNYIKHTQICSITMHVYRPLDITIPSLKVNHEVIRILRSVFTNNPPSPGKVGHATGLCVPSRRVVI